MGHSIEGGYEGVARIQAAQERIQWLPYMNVVITIQDLQKGRDFPQYYISSRKCLFHGVRQISITKLYINKFRPIFQSFDFDRD
jgi:hypothetical protein